MNEETTKVLTAALYRVLKTDDYAKIQGFISEVATELNVAIANAVGAVYLVNIGSQDNVELCVNAFARTARTGTWVNSITVGGTVYTYKDDQSGVTGLEYQWVNGTTIMLTAERHPDTTDSAYASTDTSTALAITAVDAYLYGDSESDSSTPKVRKVYGVDSTCPARQQDAGGYYFIAYDNRLYLGGEEVTV